MDAKDKVFSHPIEVRFRDLDALGHVNHAVYLSYFEQSRIAWFEHLDLLEANKHHAVPLILANIEVAYLAPLFLHQKIRATSSITAVGHKSFQILHEVYDVTGGTKFVKATVILVWFDYEQGKSIAIPAAVRDKLNQLVLAQGQ